MVASNLSRMSAEAEKRLEKLFNTCTTKKMKYCLTNQQKKNSAPEKLTLNTLGKSHADIPYFMYICGLFPDAVFASQMSKLTS